MNETIPYHIPALLNETISGLQVRPDGLYVDVTLGGSGHAKAILALLGESGRLFGFDQDEDAENNILSDGRFTFVHSNFRYLTPFLDWYGVKMIDGLLADLGVSSHHFDDETRGFSFRFEGDLDMRMNKRAGKTAAGILNTYSEAALADVFYHYGELYNARAIARAVIQARERQNIRTINDFLTIVKPFFGRAKEKKQLAQAFQALRIEVNGELDALKEMLQQALVLLKPGGRLAVITYHSLEDRLVKNFFKTGNFEGKTVQDFYGNIETPFRAVHSKVIIPDEAEIARNPRSRSAKLRIAEKI
ncbi:MAG: 16S rRNA (cytosine(1402)-N(4))-methyltransferase RsmH [Candidatus Symbiothrix sp.]|jgi:16S rRNA (cytosine1402-N4)-methyltransferase|nr:16S rRNA (cytosine(1402)-N(4))-methyltransferase RsmH [Candidatus Symbiothrix sp.]